MRWPARPSIVILLLSLCSLAVEIHAAETPFAVATYNVENYLDQAVGTRPAKAPESKAKVRESIRELRADVLALQEMGGTNALLEGRAALKSEGLDYPFWEYVNAWDTNIHVAV